MGMSQDHRSPGKHVINIGVLVHVIEPRSFRSCDKARLPADRAEGSDWAIDATGNEFLSLGEELGRAGCSHNGGAPYHAGREPVKELIVVRSVRTSAVSGQKTS